MVVYKETQDLEDWRDEVRGSEERRKTETKDGWSEVTAIFYIALSLTVLLTLASLIDRS
jgi:hypothetical protein